MKFRTLLLATIVLANVEFSRAAEPLQALENKIQFLESRLGRDPSDHRTPTSLGIALLEKARLTGNAAFYVKAQTQFQNALKIQSDSSEAILGLASAFAAQHQFKEAQECADRVLAVDAGNALALGIKGDALFSVGDVTNAERQYRLLSEKESGVFLQSRLANLAFINGDMAGAQKALEAAVEASPANLPAEVAWNRLKLGVHFLNSGNLEKAEEQYNAAKELAPDSPVVLEYLAELRGAQGKFEEAHALFDRVLKANDSPHVFQSLGDLYALEKNPTAAAEWHRKAREACLKAVESGNFHYLRQLAMLYADVENNGPEALKYAKKDYELRQDIFALDTLAWAQYRAGQFADALETIQKALARKTQDAHLLYHAGMIYSRNGNFAKGKEYLDAAKALNPYFQRFHAHR